MLRVYNFQYNEVLLALNRWGNLSLKTNPKVVIAQAQPWIFPVDINRASYEELLRVPGIGPTAARRIVTARGFHAIQSVEQLRKLRVRYKEAMPYIWFKSMAEFEKQLCFLPQLEEEVPEPAGCLV